LPEGGLAMPDKIERAHAVIVRGVAGVRRLSVRRPARTIARA
jgi:hypothetical protein